MERLNCFLKEIKLAGAEGEMAFSGYGAVFGNVDSYGDVIEPGAFSAFLSDMRTGKAAWPAMLSQHGGFGMTAEDMTPIGVWTDFSEDGSGLKIAGKLADTPRGREMYTLMKMEPRPAIDGLSIGYIAKEWEQRSKPEDPRRRLKRIELIEVSPVTFPANPKSRVRDVKGIETLQTLSDAETFLRDACGFSRSQAVAFVSRIKSLGPSDSDGLSDLVAAVKARGESLNQLTKR